MKAFLIFFAGILLPPAALAQSQKFRLPSEIIRAMDAPSAVTLLSIHPDPKAAHWFNTKFYGYRVLGQIPITSTAQRRQIMETLKRVLRDYEGGSNKCIFSPRHGVHIASGSRTYDFLICFECQEIEAYTGEHRVLHRYISGEPGVLSPLLRAAGIRIAK